MIDAAILSTNAGDARPRQRDAMREPSPEFSYALAAASLETGAARALEAHGARPEAQSSRQPAEASQQSPEPRRAAPAAANLSQETAPPTDAETLFARPSQASPAAINAQPAIIAASASAPAGAAPTVAQPAVTTLGDAAALRDAAAAKAKLATAKAPRLPPAPAALKAEFAEILARRIDKSSVFELRLDPPELGRVDGRLAVRDDGRAVLSLTFDNKDAFDFYSRDEQALRQALQQAGLTFDSGDFVFAFNQREFEAAEPIGSRSFKAIENAFAYEPQFHAEWSAGALDIRI